MFQKNRTLFYLISGFILFLTALFVIFILVGKSFLFHLQKQPAYQKTTRQALNGFVFFNSPENDFLSVLNPLLESATEDIYIALYALNWVEVRPSLEKAIKRGVRVHVVYDETKTGDFTHFFGELFDNIETIKVKTFTDAQKLSKNLMHHKFLLIDPSIPEKSVVVTGALNWTTYQVGYDPSHVFVLRDSDVAVVFLEEFLRLKKGIHGVKKNNDENYRPWALEKEYGDGKLEVWFSPQSRSQSFYEKMYTLVESSQKSIDFGQWQMTDARLANLLLKKSKEGVKIRGIAESSYFWIKRSVFPNFWDLSHHPKAQKWNPFLQNLVTDYWRSSPYESLYKSKDKKYEGFTSFFHHHFLIIDQKIVIAGTGNWTDRAKRFNDENSFILTHPKIVESFEKYFEKQYRLLGGDDSQISLSFDPSSHSFILKPHQPDLNLSGWKIIAIKTPYSENFEQDILFEKDVSSLTLSESENKLLSKEYPTEFYLVDEKENLVTSARFIP